MNEQQKTALEYHCRLGIEALREHLFCYIKGNHKITLTVDSGYF